MGERARRRPAAMDRSEVSVERVKRLVGSIDRDAERR
jgi:hypothetical protein